MNYKIFLDFNKENIDKLDFIPTLVIGFYTTGSEDLFLEQYNYMQKQYPMLDVLGVSSSSNIFHTLPHLDNKNYNCIFVLLDIDKNAYNIGRKSFESDIIYNTFTVSNIMLFSVLSTGIENKIKNIESKLAKDGCVYGMIAGASDEKYMPSLFYNGKFIEKGCVACCVDGSRYEMKGVSIHDFEPIGLRLEITKAEKFTIFELENRPALEAVEDVIGKIEQKNIDSFSHPFFLLEKGEVGDNNSLLSSLVSIDRDRGSLTLYREVTKKYRTLKLSVPIEAEDKKIKFNKLTHSSLDRGILFLFACVGIEKFYGKHEHMKIMALSKRLKTKFIGCHSFGEIGPSIGKTFSQLQNQTITMVSLYEKEK